MSELNSYLLTQIIKDVSETRSDVRSIKSQIDDITTWLQRAALLIGLWASAGLLNIAPDKAGEIAAALGSERLVFLTDVEGVKDANGEVLPSLTAPDCEALMASGTASGGMIPKLEACLRARKAGAESWIVDGRVQHMLLSALSSAPVGTQVW